jgi:hypothetical protein
VLGDGGKAEYGAWPLTRLVLLPKKSDLLLSKNWRGICLLRPLFAAALVLCRRYFIVAPSPFPAAQLVVHRR